MSKPRTESSSSFFSDNEHYSPTISDPSYILDSCEAKQARNGSAELGEKSPVPSTSTQSQPEAGIILKNEIEENNVEVEDTELAQYTPRRMDAACSTSAAAKQSTPDVNRSKRKRDSSNVRNSEGHRQPGPSKKVPEPYQKFHEGCLVTGGPMSRYPWPGMIRKAGEDDDDDPDYISYYRRKINFCVQFFTSPTRLVWMNPCNLEIFDAAKINRRDYFLSKHAVELENAIWIAKAAVNYSVEARLEKFTLPNGAPIHCLLAEIGNVISLHTINVATPQHPPYVPQHDTPASVSDADAAVAAVARVKKRMLDTRQKLQETEEANKGLKTENLKLGENVKKLKATVRQLRRRLKSSVGTATKITSLEQNLQLKDNEMEAQKKEILELRASLDKEISEKRKCHAELEKLRSEIQYLEQL